MIRRRLAPVSPGAAGGRAALGVAAVLAALAVVLGSAAPARGYVAPGAAIVSASSERREQGDDTSSRPDVSADGRFVAFSTLARNLFPDEVADPPGSFVEGGIFRRDLVSGRLELVALGDQRAEAGGEVERRGAANPSVSADGRWVSFTTGRALVPADVNRQVDVYVRDMSLALSDPLAYELVSARDGGNVPARYAERTPRRDFLDPGAEVAAGTAISDDGRTVVFGTPEVASDLPDRAALDTPAGQVLVRDRLLKRTRLVTRRAGTAEPVQSGSGQPVGAGPAVISGDGSTVAWAGQEAPQQTAFLAGENPDGATYYYLWQRIADGPATPTRRITGPADLDDPACDGGFVPDSVRRGPCYGPLSGNEQALQGIASTPPALSADGRRVAFLTGAPPRPESAVAATDLFLTDMAPGISRKAGTVELTREGTGRDPAASGPLTSVTLSGDGRFAAVVAQRTRFLLPALTLLGTPRAVSGLDELYLVDLDTRTMERAARGFRADDAGDAIGPAVSLSRDGGRLVFASAADNLFFGDANQRADVFAVDRLDGPPPVAEEAEPPVEPALEVLEPEPPAPGRLRVFVRRAPRGKIRLDIRAPKAGALSVQVRGRVPDRDGRLRGRARALASAERRVRRRSRVVVTLPLRKRYRGVLRREGTLDARSSVTLTPAADAPLARQLTVRFVAPRRTSKR